MSQREGAKISLSKLRGKSTNQSVPSISFRFDPSSNDIKEVNDTEDYDDRISENSFSDNPIEEGEEERETYQESLKSNSKLLNQRSSSLDSSSCLSQEASLSKPPPDSSSFISRITKTFEHKISEIRQEKREKESKALSVKDPHESGLVVGSFEREENSEDSDKQVGSKVLESFKSLDEKEKAEVTSSPLKSKTSLVQDITEQTNKFKTEFHKTIIKPRLSELRNRKNSRDSLNVSKTRGSLLTSLLGRDEGIVTEELLKNDEEIDRAIEAQEFVNANTTQSSLSCSFHKNNEEATLEKPISPELPNFENLNSEEIANIVTTRQYLSKILLKGLLLWKKEYSKYLFAFFGVCFFLPLPRFLAGVIFGLVVASVLFLFLLKFLLPSHEGEFVEDAPSLLLDVPVYDDCPLHKGWINELEGEYFPESYHVSLTHSVYLRLQGSMLQIDHPRKKIGKHAKPKEELNSGGFIHHRKYDLTGCQVLLLPKNLPRKWLWSRKYPICLHLRPNTFKSPLTSTDSTPSKPPANSPFHQYSEKECDVEIDGSDSELLPFEKNNEMISSLDLSSYEEITEEMCSEKSLYFFARTDREKDDWFRRFVSASELHCKKDASPSQPLPSDSLNKLSDNEIEKDSSEVLAEDSEEKKSPIKPKKQLGFDHYMAILIHRDVDTPLNINWFNCLVGRILFDFLHNQYWAQKIQERVQRKLSKLHIPYFIGDILVCGVDLGSSIPQLLSVEPPSNDARGLWIDFQATYTGSFTMSLETKLNLMKLKERAGGGSSSNPPSPAESSPQATPQTSATKTRAYSRSPSSDCVLRNVQFDTDTDDSVESSSEEEYDEEGLAEGISGAGGPTSKKLLRIVDTVAASRYFQHAAEWKVLQRAMQGVSNTRIELSVEVKHLAGTLTVNVPPPPSDRIWYGFRGSPTLVMVARPCLGDRPLNLPFLAEFIQKQLKIVFEKVFVLPNMDDLVIPVMSPLLPGQSPPPRPWEVQTPSPPPKTSPVNVKLSFNAHSQSLHPVNKAQDNMFAT